MLLVTVDPGYRNLALLVFNSDSNKYFAVLADVLQEKNFNKSNFYSVLKQAALLIKGKLLHILERADKIRVELQPRRMKKFKNSKTEAIVHMLIALFPQKVEVVSKIK